MRIKKDILDRINNPQARIRIALDLKVGEQSIFTQIKRNTINGRLTKMDALMAISKEVGCPIEALLEIVEPVNS